VVPECDLRRGGEADFLEKKLRVGSIRDEPISVDFSLEKR
jgi:hypothetical protein